MFIYQSLCVSVRRSLLIIILYIFRCVNHLPAMCDMCLPARAAVERSRNTHTHTHKHTYTHTPLPYIVCAHVRMFYTHICADRHAYMHTCIHAYMYSCMHACMHTCMKTYRACMHTCMGIHPCSCMHASVGMQEKTGRPARPFNRTQCSMPPQYRHRIRATASKRLPPTFPRG